MKLFIVFSVVCVGRLFTKLVLHFMESKGATNDLLLGFEIGLSLMLIVVVFIYLSRFSAKGLLKKQIK
jgi:uncharacterized membrane protein